MAQIVCSHVIHGRRFVRAPWNGVVVPNLRTWIWVNILFSTSPSILPVFRHHNVIELFKSMMADSDLPEKIKRLPLDLSYMLHVLSTRWR